LGILYRACKQVMRQNFIQDLLARGITENKHGVSVHDLNYEELRHEITIASFRERDIENDKNKWF
jgi:hypothetical protein